MSPSAEVIEGKASVAVNGTAATTTATNINTATLMDTAMDKNGADKWNGGEDTIEPICAELAGKVNSFLAEKFEAGSLLYKVQEQTKIAMGVIEEALERYSLEELSLSYNGGKDCLVLLILLLSAIHNHLSSITTKAPSTSKYPTSLQSVYIISPHPFPEVTSFVNTTTETYKLSLAHYTLPMKEAFTVYLEERKNVKAILVGTRRTDPHGEKLGFFDRTDHGWPGFMRVHPVIDWHYREIWGFIRHLQIPYCTLYDQGYTSLGGTTDTHPNPALLASSPNESPKDQSSGGENGEIDGEGNKQKIQRFRPAYELVEDEAERLGRDW